MMGKLEDDIKRDMSGVSAGWLPGMTRPTWPDVENMPQDEWRLMIVGRVDGLHKAMVRLARAIEERG
jgi:hypothetical protein